LGRPCRNSPASSRSPPEAGTPSGAGRGRPAGRGGGGGAGRGTGSRWPCPRCPRRQSCLRHLARTATGVVKRRGTTEPRKARDLGASGECCRFQDHSPLTTHRIAAPITVFSRPASACLFTSSWLDAFPGCQVRTIMARSGLARMRLLTLGVAMQPGRPTGARSSWCERSPGAALAI